MTICALDCGATRDQALAITREAFRARLLALPFVGATPMERVVAQIVSG